MFVCSDVFKRSLSTVERLICPIEGFPVSYRWERGMEQSGSSSASGSGSSSSGRNELVFTPVSIGRVLEFKPLVFGDEGVYRYVATSVEEQTQVSHVLCFIHFQPQFNSLEAFLLKYS